MRSSLLALLCGTALLLGCGASVVDEPSSSSTTPGAGGTGGAGGCPVLEPGDGDPCTTPGLACVLSASCCSPTATCSGGKWSVPPPACAEPCLPCGSKACGGNGVCVTVHGAISAPMEHYCAQNPCADQPTTCACAASLCPNGCDAADATEVACY
jgi:hypothetical protein